MGYRFLKARRQDIDRSMIPNVAVALLLDMSWFLETSLGRSAGVVSAIYVEARSEVSSGRNLADE